SSDLADQALRTQNHILEEDFVEVLRTGQVDDGSNAHAGRPQLDKELTEVGMLLLLVVWAGGHQRYHPMRMMLECCPDLLAIESRASIGKFLGPCAYCGKIGPRIRLGHADAAEDFTTRHAR